LFIAGLFKAKEKEEKGRTHAVISMRRKRGKRGKSSASKSDKMREQKKKKNQRSRKERHADRRSNKKGRSLVFRDTDIGLFWRGRRANEKEKARKIGGGVLGGGKVQKGKHFKRRRKVQNESGV